MNKKLRERIQMVKCMEYIVRNLNDEDLIMPWLSVGVADGDIEYGDMNLDDYDNMEYYIDPDSFAQLMDLFLRLMSEAHKEDSGLYCGGVVSKKGE